MGSEKKKLGMVLSGGGARGFAHLGVLQALEEMGITPDIISGTSAGAIAGALYADGHNPKEVAKIMMEKSFIRYAELSIPRGGGLMKLSGIRSLLKNKVSVQNLEELNIPLYVCATDMNRGESRYFSSGPIVERVLASASIPVIFQMVEIDGVQYADGGVLNNLPVDPLVGKADVIIGVNVTPPSEDYNLKSMFQIAERSFHLSIAANVLIKSKHCDYYIEMPELMDYNLLKSSHGQEIYDIGYMKAKQYFKKHPLNLQKEES